MNLIYSERVNKDFSKWHPVKQNIQDNTGRPFYSEREVRWCHLGLNVGSEIDGKGPNYARPVLILKSFSREMFFGIPITTSPNKNKYSYDIDLDDGKSRKAILSQLRLLDSKRLGKRIGTISLSEFQEIKQALIAAIA